MENKTQLGRGGGSSSSTSFDQLFGSMDSSSSSSSSSTTGLFGSIFPPPSLAPSQRKHDVGNQVGSAKSGIPDNSKGESSSKTSKHKSSSIYTETGEPSYFSSSIYYGGQENYSPRKNMPESHQTFKKEEKDPNGTSPNSASRGNWWQGSLYY